MKRHRPRARRGYTLVFFAMFLFGFMALAALVIDIGFARLTSRQLKTATDSAALAAASLTDVLPDDPSEFIGRNETSDLERRIAAADRIRFLFDDDFDASEDAWNYGAGPRVEFHGGIPLADGFYAAQRMTIPDPPVYKPVLELNLGDAAEGDIVADNEKIRVRLQRNSSPPIQGISSNGGPVPYLFARGSMLGSRNKATGMELTVESVAEFAPVVRVGVKQPLPGLTIPGAIPFAVHRTVWEPLPKDIPESVSLGDGSAVYITSPAVSIGETVTISPSPVGDLGSGYCAILDANSRVIGFGWASIAGLSDPAYVSVQKHMASAAENTVARENATAWLGAAWDVLALLTEADRDDVIRANRTFQHPLMAPLLVE